MAGVADTSIIRGAAFKSQKLAETLAKHGYEAAALIEQGFDYQATWLVLEYFAYESKVKPEMAITMCRTFGSLGLKRAFDEATNPSPDLGNLLLRVTEALEIANHQTAELAGQIEARKQQDEKVEKVYPFVSKINAYIVENDLNSPPRTKAESRARWATIAEWLLMFVPEYTCPTFRRQLGARVAPSKTILTGERPKGASKKSYHVSQWLVIAEQYRLMTEVENIDPATYKRIA